MTRRDREPFRAVLTGGGRPAEPWRIDRDQVAPACPVAWSVERRILRGGRQEGVEVIDVDGGGLRCSIVPTRGMGILDVVGGDVRLGWDSPVREVVHPSFVDLASRGGLGWLEGFNEWLVRCGLEWAGAPGTDRFVTNTGAEAEMDLWLHGAIANRPASEVEVVVDRAPPFAIRVRGRVDECSFYGPRLELWTEISIAPGGRGLRIEDRVTNRGGSEQEFQLIYHVNHGPPLLEEGARFRAPMQRVTPINDHAARGIAGFAEHRGPTPGFVEEVYCIRPLADERGETLVQLHDAAAERGVTLAYPLEPLPCLTLWKSTRALEDGYVAGLEPGTGFPHNRGIERARGRVPVLAPGAARAFSLAVEIQHSAAEVRAASERIAAIQGGREAVIDRQPETGS